MKIDLYKSESRGTTQIDWLLSRHSFSFGDYYNAKRTGFGALRVLNDDKVKSGAGFPTHSHNNMEIVSIVLEGSLEHRDSMGNHGLIVAGDVQRMSAGKGVTHSEYNSGKKPLHFLQIWIIPKEKNIEPGYEQKSFSEKKRTNKLLKIVSNSKSDSGLYIHQDVAFYMGLLDKDLELSHRVSGGAFLFLIKGNIKIEDTELKQGDAVEITDADKIIIKTLRKSELLLIDVPVK